MKYSVEFFCRLFVVEQVEASSPQEAEDLARKLLAKRQIYAATPHQQWGLRILDGKDTISGFGVHEIAWKENGKWNAIRPDGTTGEWLMKANRGIKTHIAAEGKETE